MPMSIIECALQVFTEYFQSREGTLRLITDTRSKFLMLIIESFNKCFFAQSLQWRSKILFFNIEYQMILKPKLIPATK